MSQPEPAAGPSNRGIALRLALSMALAVGFAAALWPYLRAVPEDLSIAAWAVPAYLATLVPYHLARAGRWYFLLRPLGRIRAGDSLRISMAGYMWIALLPFRLGELARPLLLTQRSDITVHRALGTVAIERVLDGLVICGLFFAASGGIELDSSDLVALQQASTGVMALFGVALLGLLVMARFPRAMGGLIDATVGRVLPRAGRWAAELSHGVSQGLAALPRGGPLLAFVSVTTVYWACNAVGMWVLALGCGLPLTLAETVTVMAVINIALLVPGGPAQVGIFHAGVVLGLGLFIAPSEVKAVGSTYVFLLYVCQLGSIVAFGVWAQRALALDWRSVLKWRPDARESSSEDEPDAKPEDLEDLEDPER